MKESALHPTAKAMRLTGYQLRSMTLQETRIPRDFIISCATIADHVYLTGTTRGHSDDNTVQGIAVKAKMGESLATQLGVMFTNYLLIDRFNAATGMVWDTMGPFGAMIATAMPPGQDHLLQRQLPDPSTIKYRLYFVFRGTSLEWKRLYFDDAFTDAKAFKRDNRIGDRAGQVAAGFMTTYESCQNTILQLLVKGKNFLNDKHKEFCRQRAAARQSSPQKPPPPSLNSLQLAPHQIEIYIVGHSLGGAVATLCAYDLACHNKDLNPVLITFGSPTVGDVDFAVDFERVMIKRNEYHPQTGYLRSVRVVAQSESGADIVTSGPALLRNSIHVNTEVPIPTLAGNIGSAHSMNSSYLESLKRR